MGLKVKSCAMRSRGNKTANARLAGSIDKRQI
jgi:hypothetical protein